MLPPVMEPVRTATTAGIYPAFKGMLLGIMPASRPELYVKILVNNKKEGATAKILAEAGYI
jgi:hypothetical protein